MLDSKLNVKVINNVYMVYVIWYCSPTLTLSNKDILSAKQWCPY